MAEHKLVQRYQYLFVFDTETSGLSFQNDEIIEFSGMLLAAHGMQWECVQQYDELIQLTSGKRLPEEITRLTGITPQMLCERGISKQQLCSDLQHFLAREDVLLAAYNAHFDLSFLFYTLMRWGDPAVLKGKDKLDLLTVYKDRRDYPHKLCNAIEAYGLQGEVANSHRAIDDVQATVAVLEAMEQECCDLDRYVNLFGYQPKYGVQGKRISSITYLPQPYDHEKKLYE